MSRSTEYRAGCFFFFEWVGLSGMGGRVSWGFICVVDWVVGQVKILSVFLLVLYWIQYSFMCTHGWSSFVRIRGRWRIRLSPIIPSYTPTFSIIVVFFILNFFFLFLLSQKLELHFLKGEVNGVKLPAQCYIWIRICSRFALVCLRWLFQLGEFAWWSCCVSFRREQQLKSNQQTHSKQKTKVDDGTWKTLT